MFVEFAFLPHGDLLPPDVAGECNPQNLVVIRSLVVILTSPSNDKGVDILAERQGAKIAIQCKKYKGVVGSPALQAFLGAMQHAEAQKGFFVTTGVFSIEAERMASEHPIELIDGSALGRLIREALHKD